MNVTRAHLDKNFAHKTAPLYQYDYGQVLKFEGVELPDAYEVHFSNQDAQGTAKVQIGTSDGVEIPDEYLLSGEPIYVWVFMHTGESDGETEYKTVIPVHKRAQKENAEPTPVQQDIITRAIAALNAGVQKTEEAQNAWESMSATAETLAPDEPATASYADGVLSFGIPQGIEGNKGDSPVITTQKSGRTTTIYADGVAIGAVEDGKKGDKGDVGTPSFVDGIVIYS